MGEIVAGIMGPGEMIVFMFEEASRSPVILVSVFDFTWGNVLIPGIIHRGADRLLAVPTGDHVLVVPTRPMVRVRNSERQESLMSDGQMIPRQTLGAVPSGSSLRTYFFAVCVPSWIEGRILSVSVIVISSPSYLVPALFPPCSRTAPAFSMNQESL